MTQAITVGKELRRQFTAAERKGHFRAAALILPLLLFVLVTFATPVVLLLTRAVYDPSIARTLPATIEALRTWDGKETPDEAVYAALVTDFKNVSQENTAALVGKRLNYEISGVRSKVIGTVTKAGMIDKVVFSPGDEYNGWLKFMVHHRQQTTPPSCGSA